MSSGPNAANAILIVGAPRSGTTWLAKIFDSHPDILYRHEPDEVSPPTGAIAADIARWARQTDPRTAGKQPFFPKSWQSTPARWLRTGLAYAGAAVSRAGLPDWPIPDLADTGHARLAIKSVRLDTAIGAFARTCRDGRAILILRHPCGQVASVMRGTRAGRFVLAEDGTDMPFDEANTIAFAARHGLQQTAFQRQTHAAKYAWAWRAFNETAVAAIAGLPNARLTIYETLCVQIVAEAKTLLTFAGLSWHAQTATFLTRSTTHKGESGYYAVVQNSLAAAERWRTTMSPADQSAVRTVMRDSPLAQYWPDLTAR